MITQYASTDYPANFPCPDRGNYSILLDSGLLRDASEYPAPEQRREYDQLPGMVSVSFTLPVLQLYAWQTWMNTNGFKWFNIELAHPFMAQGTLKERTPVRCADEQWNIQYRSHGTVSIAVLLELSPSVFAESDF